MKHDQPLVYIIVLNYNGREDACECLDSIKNLDYNNFKTLVSDNGSTDGSIEHIKKNFPWVKIIENYKNLGFSEGNNIGIKYALERGSDYILLLNNDVIVSFSLLKDLLEVVTKDRTAGIVGPKILNYYLKDRIWFAGGKIHSWLGNTWHTGNGHKDSSHFQRVVEEDYQTGCALLIKREVINKIGMFDPEYFMYFEDSDLCIRARKGGFKVLCVQYARTWHKVSAGSGGGLTPQKAYFKAKSGVRFFRKYSPRISYYTTVPICALCYIFMASLIERLKNNRGVFVPFIKGLISGIKE